MAEHAEKSIGTSEKAEADSVAVAESINELISMIDMELYTSIRIRFPYQKYCGYLSMEDLYSTNNIYLAARRCAAGFMHKKDTKQFFKSPWINSNELRKDVLSGKFVPKYYPERSIIERGKARQIKPPVFTTKVIGKVMCDLLIRPILEPKMVTSNYASIKGRGTDKMYEDVLNALNKSFYKQKKGICEPMNVILGDYSGFFASIDTHYLIDELFAKIIHDKRILELFRKFSPDQFGLSLGNEISQVPASYLPSLFDHYVKDKCGYPYYRYMDDSLAIIPEKDTESYINSYSEYAEKMHLKVNLKKIHVIKLGYPFTFCKERFLYDKKKKCYYRIKNPAIPKNEARKLRYFKQEVAAGRMSYEHALKQYRGVRGIIANHPHTYKTLAKLDGLFSEIRSPAMIELELPSDMLFLECRK